jgi:hypothetical protein
MTWVRALLPAICALCAAARAQTTHREAEPNGVKAEATAVPCLAAGDSVTGTTTGASTAPGDAQGASADTFRIATCPLPAGLWRHRLLLSTAGPDAFSLSVRGRSVSGPPGSPSIDAASDVPLQYAPGSGARYVQWYGFGRAEELFVRVEGTPDTQLPYTLTLATDAVLETALGSALRSGRIEISTVGQGYTTDTEIVVLDAAWQPVPGWRNDDAPGTGSKQSRLARTFPAGTYHVAIGRFNVADAALSGADDAYPDGPVLDFPDALLSWSASGPLDISFTLTDAQGTLAVPAALDGAPFQLAWFRLTVVDAPPPILSVCPGDGSGAPCPCGNSGAAGHGCANSVQAGGGLLRGAGLASVGTDSLVLAGDGLPLSSALYFQGTTLANHGAGIAFGDGLRCATGTVLRLATKTSFGGVSQYPEAGDAPISLRGQIPAAGGLRTYQCWYRNSDPGFCTSAYFNLTNALAVTWIP